MSQLTGRCMCDAITFTITGQPYGIISCHCKDCQRLHGNYNPMLVSPEEEVQITDNGKLVWFSSSPSKQRGFCSVCGTALFMRNTENGRLLTSVGALDDTHPLKNIKNIFTEEAGSYYVMPPEESD